ncbi:MAG TPA: hypothetical protein VMR31_15855 [Myxococcota bacterium]|nr:hypothetical protein [Myxococcota bacterium]
MQSVELFRIPGTIVVEHHPVQRAVRAGWESLSTSEFRQAITRGLSECGRLRAKSWLVDLTKNPGVPSQADLEWLMKDAAPLTLDSGIRAVINVHGASALAALGASRWTKSASQGGLVTCDCRSLADALEMAADVAEGKLRPDNAKR